jgi:hypothetical protein
VSIWDNGGGTSAATAAPARRLTSGLPLQQYWRGDVRELAKQKRRRTIEEARNEESHEGSTLCIQNRELAKHKRRRTIKDARNEGSQEGSMLCIQN